MARRLTVIRAQQLQGARGSADLKIAALAMTALRPSLPSDPRFEHEISRSRLNRARGLAALAAVVILGIGALVMDDDAACASPVIETVSHSPLAVAPVS